MNVYFFFKFFFSAFLFYFWDSERQSMNGGGAERERETQNRKQAPGSEPSAQSLTRGSNSRTGPRDRDLAEVGRLTDCALCKRANILKKEVEKK